MMNILGFKVHVVNRHEQFSQTLKKVKGKIINFSSYNSSSSSEKSKEIPLGALDGADIDMSSFQRRGRGFSSRTVVIRFILIIVDTSDGLTREMIRAMAEFPKDFPKHVSLHVVWLDKLGVDEDKLPSIDTVIAKPLHGSRLYRVLKLTQEKKEVTSSRIKVQQHPLIRDDSVDVNGCSNKKLPLTGKKILVVEDDRTLLMICSTAVSKLGATTYT